MKRRLTILALLLASCSTSEEALTPEVDGAVTFTSEISTRVSTDLSDNSSAWEAGDQIGIYMNNSGSYTYSNVNYTANLIGAKTDFTVGEGETPILVPNNIISGISFIAYSPYSSAVSGDMLSIDLSDQSTVAARNACDFMVATSSSYTSAPTEAVELQFEHQLAMLKFDVTCGETVSDLTGITCEISGLNATQSYGVLTGAADLGTATEGAIEMLVEKTSSTTATVTAIVHTTTAAASSVGVAFTLGAQSFTSSFSPTAAFAANQVYAYDVLLGYDEATFSGLTIEAWGTEDSGDTLYPMGLDLAYVDGVFEIYTATGLRAFADLVNGVEGSTAVVSWGDSGITFGTTEQVDIDGVLTTDVDLGGSSSPWTAIGTYRYTGTFDGGGYLVSGLYISSSSVDYQGLFGCVGSGGVVKSVGVSGEVTGRIYIGGVVGFNYGSVMNCYNTAKVSGNSSVGGVVGENNYGSVTTNCYNTAAVSGETYNTGGVVGYNCIASVTNCYNTAAVSGLGIVGGVVGFNDNGSVTSCYWVDVDGDGATSGLGTGTDTTTIIASDATEDDTFTGTLNDGVTTEGMCYWVWDSAVNGGYPTLDFGSYYSAE